MAGLSPNLRLVGDDTPSAVNPKPAFEDEDVIVEATAAELLQAAAYVRKLLTDPPPIKRKR